MKKLAIGATLVLALGAIGWSAFWFVGKGKVEADIDAEFARLEAAGWTVSQGPREIGGFPTGYRVVLRELGLVRPEGGTLVRVPELRLDWQAVARDVVQMSLPGQATIDLPASQAMKLRDPSLPDILRLTVEVDGLAAHRPHAEDWAVSADRVRVWVDQDDYHLKGSLAGEMATYLPGSEAEGTGRAIDAARLIGDVTMTEPGGSPVAMHLDAEDVSAAFSTSAMGQAFFDALIREGAPGSAHLNYEIAAFNFTADVADPAPGGFVGRMAVSSGRANGMVHAEGGQLSLATSSERVVWSLLPTDPAHPLRGSVRVGASQYEMRMPTAPAETAVESTLSFSLSDVEGDEGFWQALDPKGALVHDPASLSLESVMMIKVRPRTPSVEGAPRVRFEPMNVALQGLSLSALGATVTASGDLDVLQPVVVPLGALSVKAEGLVGAIGDLERAGLIGPDQREMFDAILQVYARPGSGADSWEAEIGFGTEGVTVNGLPVQ